RLPHPHNDNMAQTFDPPLSLRERGRGGRGNFQRQGATPTRAPPPPPAPPAPLPEGEGGEGRLRKRTSCSTISPALRLRSTPFSPLAQKTQPMPHPTCVLMQAVRRRSSWINTHSISLRSRSSSSNLCVSSLARKCFAMRLDSGTKDSASCCRNALGRSVMA